MLRKILIVLMVVIPLGILSAAAPKSQSIEQHQKLQIQKLQAFIQKQEKDLSWFRNKVRSQDKLIQLQQIRAQQFERLFAVEAQKFRNFQRQFIQSDYNTDIGSLEVGHQCQLQNVNGIFTVLEKTQQFIKVVDHNNAEIRLNILPSLRVKVIQTK